MPSASPFHANNLSETHDPGRVSNLEGESQDEVVMAIDMRGLSSIGCAYFVARDEVMYFMEDCKLADDSVIDACLDLL